MRGEKGRGKEMVERKEEIRGEIEGRGREGKEKGSRREKGR